jgi:hypothetical protein
MSEDDFWDEPESPEYGLGEHVGKMRGRYHFPDPPGFQRSKDQAPGWMRMTNLASAFSDQIRLQKWRERMILLGLREHEVLFDELAAKPIETMEPSDAKAWLEEHANRAAAVARGDHGSRRGTARHIMLQTYLEAGVIVGTRSMRLQMESLLEALDRHHLEFLPGMSERRVCNTAFLAMGTLDAGVLCQRTGQEGILDLKTAKEFWSYQEAAGQQEGYDSADWMWEGPPNSSGRWVRPPRWTLLGSVRGPAPGKRVALLAHMPQEPGPNQLPVEIHEVDLSYGRTVMEVAMMNVSLRSIGAARSAARQIGGIRGVLPTEAPAGVASSPIVG